MFCRDRYVFQNSLKLLSEVKSLSNNLGDNELMNDYIFHNYSRTVNYFDDDFEKTAFFMDMMSLSDVNDAFTHRTQNYELQSMQFMPAYAFRKYCAGSRNCKNEYPREVRNMRLEKRKN